jgi:RNA polymerase sigma factor FliA
MSTCTAAQHAAEVVEILPTPQELWQRYHKQGDGHTENALVEQYLPLVRSVMSRLAITLPDHVDHDDLQSAGMVGLLHALRHYDPACGTTFQTYARLRIRGAMLDELRRMDWVPRTIHEKARRIQEVMAQLEQKFGRAPTEAEVAKGLNMTQAQYEELLAEIRPATFVCLDAVGSADGEESGTISDVVADPAGDGPMEQASRNELKALILQRLKELPRNQSRVLALYYGEDLHLREIAEVLGVTESRVCQIHSQAILSIRSYLQRLESGREELSVRSQHT